MKKQALVTSCITRALDTVGQSRRDYMFIEINHLGCHTSSKSSNL